MPTVKIGQIAIKNPVCLAPMAGTSAVSYREICHEFGSSYAPTELCSARSIKYNGIDKSYRYMEINPEKEGITAIQLFGADSDDFEVAIRAICADDRLKDVSMFDINMGCPVPKVVKTGSGSALIRTPELASDIVKTSVRVAAEYGKPVTVKTRVGFENINEGPEFIKYIADAGANMICVHGRTAKQMYQGQADFEAIAAMREVVSEFGIPFFANGDIKDGESAQKMLDVTKADGLMIGRAAMGNPWVFEEVRSKIWDKDVQYNEPSSDERKQMLLRELRGRISHLPEDVAVREFRGMMAYYVKGMRGAASLKVKLCSACTLSEVEEILYS